MRRLLIVAGDPSGDLYGSMLMRALRRLRPGLHFEIAGGPLMRKASGVRDVFHYDLASKGMTGFIAPFKKLPTFFRLYRTFRRSLSDGAIAAVVCIDFYGFNQFVLSAAKKSGTPSIYFVSPQVWATRSGRIKHIKKCVDRMLVIFPFEESLYKKAGVPVTWVGHPLLDILPRPNHSSPSRTLRLGLLPGSRWSEVKRHLPVFLKAASRILKDYPRTQVNIFGVPHLPDSFYSRWLKPWRTPGGEKAQMIRESDYSQRSRQDFILTSSGTATLENGLLGIPMVVIYKAAWPTYFIGTTLAQIPYFAMVNLLSGKKIVPEFLQGAATELSVSRAALDILGNPHKARAMRNHLLALRKKLGDPGAIDRAAKAVLETVPA